MSEPSEAKSRAGGSTAPARAAYAARWALSGSIALSPLAQKLYDCAARCCSAVNEVDEGPLLLVACTAAARGECLRRIDDAGGHAGYRRNCGA